MNRKRIVLIGVIVVLVALLALAWNVWFSATRVAFINYQVISLGQIAKANDNPYIKISELDIEKLNKINSYDMVFINGMGLRITEDQRALIQKAADKGLPVLTTAATNPANNIVSLNSTHQSRITAYLGSGGRTNYRNMLGYIRKYVDKKILFVPEPGQVVERSNYLLTHADVNNPDEEDVGFNTIAEYNAYLKENNLWNDSAPRIIVTGVMGEPSGLIQALEESGDVVYYVSGFQSLFSDNKIDSIAPSVVINMAHGRLGDFAVEYFSKQNIPLFCPLNVNRLVEEWEDDKMGMSGGFLSQSVVTPEIDGAIRPFALFGHRLDQEGLQQAFAIPERVETFVSTINKYVALKQKDNKNKRVAIYYYKGPGQNAMTAAGMEVTPSLYNLLLYLKQEGFNVDGLPSSSQELGRMIQTQGAVFGTYAEGAFDEFMKNGQPELISKDQYEEWVSKALRPERYAEVVEANGEFPGAYMTSEDGSLGVARLRFGNVVLLPQNMAGSGSNSFQIIHGTNTAPPHTYIASYLWTRYGFGADAMIHFGTHGSLEFTPRKQVALSSNDWPDRLVGDMPHFYVYSIGNVGEGMIAKRRSYAGLQSYLTPPFLESNVRGMYKELDQTIQTYNKKLAEQTPDTPAALARKKAELDKYSLAVKALAVKMGIHRELELDSVLTIPYDEEDVARIENFAEELATEKITGQLYTMGQPYESARITSSVYAMATDPVAYSLLALDKLRGKADADVEKHKSIFTQRYLNPAKNIVTRLLANPALATDAFICQTAGITMEELEKARKIDQQRNAPSGMMAMMMAMGSSGGGSAIQAIASMMPQSNQKEESKTSELEATKRPISQQQTKQTGNDESQRRPAGHPGGMSQMGDSSSHPGGMPPMDGMPSGHPGDMPQMSDSTSHPGMPMAMRAMMAQARDEDEDDETSMEGSPHGKMPSFIKNMLKGKSEEEIFALAEKMGMPKEAINRMREKSQEQHDNTQAPQGETTPAEKPQSVAKSVQGGGMSPMSMMSSMQKEEYSKDEINFALAIMEVERTIKNIGEYKKLLLTSPKSELSSMVNALGGGYTNPSPGGDPIVNPNTIPTGRNLYGINAEATPGEAAWEKGKALAENTIEMYKRRHNDSIPRKVSYTLWSGEFIETEGATIAQILYMLGVEPIRDAFGRVTDLRLIPSSELGRPRIDVVVQTSGQLRDIAASRLFLINRAVEMAAAAKDDDYENLVTEGVVEAERTLIEKGVTPKEAREMSSFRVFGAANGGYGTGIQGMVMSGDRWETEQEIADTYINNMGAYYGSEKNWELYRQYAFQAALTRTDAVIQPRQSNTWGALSLDHVYEFMGGLNLAVRNVTGKDPDAYLSDYRNRNNFRMQEVKEAIGVESRTTIFNPTYIKEKMKGEAGSAGTFAEIVQNTYAWNVMKPKAIDKEMWDEIYNVYVKDKFDLGIQDYFEKQNPAALQEITAVMLETVRKGMWKASEQQVADIAALHTELVNKHKPSCSGFVCDNAKLRLFIAAAAPQAAQEYTQNIDRIRQATASDSKGVVMKKEEMSSADEQTNVVSNVIVAVIVVVAVICLILLVRYRRKKLNAEQ